MENGVRLGIGTTVIQFIQGLSTTQGFSNGVGAGLDSLFQRKLTMVTHLCPCRHKRDLKKPKTERKEGSLPSFTSRIHVSCFFKFDPFSFRNQLKQNQIVIR